MSLLSFLAVLAQAAGAPDTLPQRRLDPLVVTAERAEASLSTASAAVTRISADELARFPRATLADVLRRAPGFALVDFDGLGFDPQLMVRGFYGGGEAEYVIVLIDGTPVNQLQTGLVAWDVLPPLATIEAIEVVRGGASPLYGDAAIGGVINVITRRPGAAIGSQVRWSASGGSFGTFRASGALEGAPAGGITLAAAADRTAGFRHHAERTALRSRGGLRLVEGSQGRLGMTLQGHWRGFDEPGPLLASLLDQGRNGSDPLFRFDHTTDRAGGVTFNGLRRLGSRSRISGAVSGELRRLDAIRTLALAPGFGDTKARRAASDRAAVSLQLERDDAPRSGLGRLLLGVELSRGGLDSRYYQVTGGTRAEYASASGERGALDSQGESVRLAGSVYGQYTVQPAPALRLSLGLRYDRLRDRFAPDIPEDLPDRATTHSALSPRAGVNLRYLNRAGGSGNAYVSLSRSFKAPTLDQLFDQRNIPVPFPPFAIQTSNPGLVPQRGTSLELGLYQHAALGRGIHASGSLSAYQMSMSDELDFDIESFRYVNIGRSRHRGVEAGLTLETATVSGFVGYSLQAAISRSGDNTGRHLKAIPRHSLNGGLSVRPHRRLEAGVFITGMGKSYLDDANSVTLPAYVRIDGRLALAAAGLIVSLDGRNLLGKRYSSTGFLDPAGSGEAYLYPAAGRALELGVRRAW